MHTLTPAGTIELPDEAMPCALCGQAVHEFDPNTVRRVLAAYRRLSAHSPLQPVYAYLALCSDCRPLADRAAAIAEANPGIAGQFRNQRQGMAEGLVAALAMLDQPIPDPSDHARLEVLAHHLAVLGNSSIMSSMCTTLGVGLAAESPWSAVPEVSRAAMRRAFAAACRDALDASAPPVEVKCPPVPTDDAGRGREPLYAIEHGCTFCGVASLTVSRADARAHAPVATWTRHDGPISSLIGRHRLGRWRGWLCPACEAAAQITGSLTPSAAERALVTFAGLGVYWSDRWHLVGRPIWGTAVLASQLSGGEPPVPSRRPWAHLGTLAKVRASLAKSLGAPDPGPALPGTEAGATPPAPRARERGGFIGTVNVRHEPRPADVVVDLAGR